jgi:hypothetical protein
MRDRIHWLPRRGIPTEHFETRTVYVAHYHAPFAGFMAAADTAFTIPAKVRIRGRWFHGFIAAHNGMAYIQDHGFSVFYYGNKQKTRPAH